MAFIGYLKDPRLIAVLVIVALLLVADALYGIHLGIEFIGGTQIPITLEHTVNPDVMSTIISNLQQRTATFGLKQVTVEGIGGSEVYVIVPTVSQADIASTVSVIQKQGIFQGIASGKEAINGSTILGGATGLQPVYTVLGNNVTWSVNFYITQQGAVRFSKVAFGQANKPLYMFLDRPTSSIVLINESLIQPAGIGFNEKDAIGAIQLATVFGNQTIPVEILSKGLTNWNTLYRFFNTSKGSYKNVILQAGTPNSILSNLTVLNYTLTYQSASNMTPQIASAATNTSEGLIVNVWPAIGLLSAPLLNPGVTNGNINQGYVITGASPITLTLQQKINFAKNQSQSIASILSGGALPVHVIVGIPITIPATLGQHFEYISILALVMAVIAVGITIVVRYKKFFLITPIILTTVAELFIITSVIGLVGTIDLSAVAGMIAVVGTGVDAQIIITDEVLTGPNESGIKSKLNHAFYVVWADAVLLVIAMLPLLFSTSLVTVIGFAESTILGALLGALVTRPAYGAIISKHYAGREGA